MSKEFADAVQAYTHGTNPKERAKKLETALGYPPSKWDGKRHGRDQLIGILRKLEDGKDPYEDERHNGLTDFANEMAFSVRRDRDERDGQLGRDVDSGAWRRPPDAHSRASLKTPPSLFQRDLGLT